jgi:hypothetical protein
VSEQELSGYGQPTTEPCRGCVYHTDHGLYQVNVSPSSGTQAKYVARIPIKVFDVSDMEAFVRFNREHAEEVFSRHDKVRAVVTFSRLLTFEEYETVMRLTEGSDIIVRSTCVLSSSNGRAETLNVPGLSREQVDSLVVRGTFRGIFCVDADLDAGAYKDLASSADVYLLDLTDVLAREELNGRYDPLEVIIDSPFFLMQDLRLAKDSNVPTPRSR